MTDIITYLRQPNFAAMVFKILFAVIVGGAIGIEREQKARAAGFRTYVLVALGATLTIILAQYIECIQRTLWADAFEIVGKQVDISRMATKVVSGVGFLGTGTIFAKGTQKVKGITTAAGLWMSACLGLVIGSGFYECALFATALSLVVMAQLPTLEDKMLSSSKRMNVSIRIDNADSLVDAMQILRAENIRVIDLEIEKSNTEEVNAFLCLSLNKKRTHAEVLAGLAAINGLISINEN